MNMLLRLMEWRVVAVAAVLLAAVAAADRWHGWALTRVDLWLHPPAEALSPLAADLRKDVDERGSARLRGLHRAVSAEIQAARAQGFAVDKLQRLADSALTLDTAAYRLAAIERLNKLRLAIPQKKETFRPAAADDANPDFFVEPRPKRAARRR